MILNEATNTIPEPNSTNKFLFEKLKMILSDNLRSLNIRWWNEAALIPKHMFMGVLILAILSILILRWENKDYFRRVFRWKGMFDI